MNPKMPKARWMLQQCSWVCLLAPLKTRYSQHQVGHPTDVDTCDLFFCWGWERQVGRRGVQSRLKRTSLISRKSSHSDTLSSSPKPKPQKPCSNRVFDSIWTALAVGVGGPLRYGWVYLCCTESLCLRNLHLAMSNEVPSGEPWMNRV